MSGKFVRASKFRHVHGEATRKDQCHTGLSRVLFKGDNNNISINGKFIAVPMSGGGGPVTIINRENPGRAPTNVPTLNVHSSDVTETAFSPFLSNVIATGSEDCRVAVSVLPEDGLTENITAASNVSTIFAGHQKKILNLDFHPTANILASASADNSVRLWDLIAGEEVSNYEGPDTFITDMKFNANGSQLATLSKDHLMRIFDPRAAAEVLSTQAFDGPKSTKLFWAENVGLVGGVGHNRLSKRIINLWDPRKFADPVHSVDLDTAAGVLLPHFDPDTSMLYLAGKGDSTISYYEVTTDGIFFLSAYRDSESTKGAAFLPKRFCDVNKCEVAVAARLMRDYVMPISFQVPRKSDLFQPDLFPDTYAGVPSLTPEQYRNGENAEPQTISMKPGAAPAAAAQVTAAMPAKSRAQLQEELDAANATIEELRAELAKLKA